MFPMLLSVPLPPALQVLSFSAFLSFRCESTVQLQRLPNTDSYCLILPPNLKSAIAAVTYMAEQLKKQDTDDTVRDVLDAARHGPRCRAACYPVRPLFLQQCTVFCPGCVDVSLHTRCGVQC